MKILFLDCGMGCAGDMLAAALYGLCPDREKTLAQLNSFGIPGVVYSAERAEKCGVAGTRLRVSFDGAEEGGNGETCHHNHEPHPGDIKALLDGLRMPEKAREDAKKIYDILASAEAMAHGCSMEHIHFHELGTMDAVADISAVCFLMNVLGPERVVCSPVRMGYGTVKCAHGILPVPAPATAAILTGIPVYAGNIEGELCTPTGAALLKYFASEFGIMPAMTPVSTGYGMGMRDYPAANCVRAMWGEAQEQVTELCCDVDDMSPEDVGYAIGVLRKNGALDVSWQASGMKKDRPGVQISCLCRPEDRDGMVRLIFKYTSTIGIREVLCSRFVLRRSFETEKTPWGPVRIKRAEGFQTLRSKPEFDDVSAIADQTGLSPAEIRKTISGGQDNA